MRCRNLASCRVSPALLACLAFQSYFSFLLPLMKSSSLLLLFLACSECHGMCVADKHGVLLVSLRETFSDCYLLWRSFRFVPPFLVWSWNGFLSENQLAGKCLLVSYSFQLVLSAFVHTVSSTGWSLELCVRGDQERGRAWREMNKQELMYFVPTNESIILMISWTSCDSQEQVMQM